MSFTRELDLALRARCTLIVVPTPEEPRLLDAVRASGTRRVVVWDAADGFEPSPFPSEAEGGRGRPIRDPLLALDHVLGLTDDAVVVLRDFHEYWGLAAVKRKLRSVAQRLRHGRAAIVVSCPAARIPPELSDEAVVLDFPLPSPDELRRELEVFSSAGPVSLTPLGREKLVAAAAGLTALQMRRQLGRSFVEHGGLDDRHIALMAEAKRQILRDNEALEYSPPSDSIDDLGGLEALKGWLRQRERAFSREAREYGLPAPRGMALLGIPGTGKSLAARTVGALWRIPVIRLDVGAIFGSLVGESEERLRRALRVADALAPCVLWIDEVEKALAAAGNDGGTTARVLGGLLTWMQEKRSPCFVVLTANRVEALPPELLRRGRLDELFFLDLPSLEERRAILGVHLRRRRRLPGDFDLDRLAARSEGFVGGELEQAIIDGMYAAFHDGREVGSDDIEAGLARLVPLSVSHRETVERLRTWLVEGRARSASFVRAEDACRRFVPPGRWDASRLLREN
jgi:AAA+ superfamily predicted ATPase